MNFNIISRIISYLITLWNNRPAQFQMPGKLQMVQMENGLYAIRKNEFLLGWRYKDLRSNGYWWSADNYQGDCQDADREKVLKVYKSLSKKVKVLTDRDF